MKREISPVVKKIRHSRRVLRALKKKGKSTEKAARKFFRLVKEIKSEVENG